MIKNDIRAASEERASPLASQLLKGNTHDNNSRLFGNMKKVSSNYDNNYTSVNSPLLARKSTGVKFWQGKIHANPLQHSNKAFNTYHPSSCDREKAPFLYDRRLNKSFETANDLMDENLSKCQNDKSIKSSLFRRSSTPQLHSMYLDNNNSRDSVHNSSWCCGNFVLKQWKKMNQQC